VNYAGSLTGRDFRAIAQVTPFVIYDLVPSDVFDAWVALSTLVPLLWQPSIENINAYSVSISLTGQSAIVSDDRVLGHVSNGNQEFSSRYRPLDVRMVQQIKIPYYPSLADTCTSLWTSHAFCNRSL
jgi:hypothetical protein